MIKKEKDVEKSDQELRREKYIEYQNRRKEKLDKLGEHKLSIRLERSCYENLTDLCEVLGYRRPEAGRYNLIETYSEVFKYMMRVSSDSIEYKPKSEEAKELLNLHRFVSHLKYDKNFADDEIIVKLESKCIHVPLSPLRNKVVKSQSDKLHSLDNKVIKHDRSEFIRNLLSKNIVIERMIEMDNQS